MGEVFEQDVCKAWAVCGYEHEGLAKEHADEAQNAARTRFDVAQQIDKAFPIDWEGLNGQGADARSTALESLSKNNPMLRWDPGHRLDKLNLNKVEYFVVATELRQVLP